MPDISEIIRELYSINEETLPKWIAAGVNSLTPQMLEHSINEWEDPLLVAEYYHLDNPVVKGIAKAFVFKPYWERVEQFLNSPDELYNEIAKDPAKKRLLDTPRGKAWLGFVRRRSYDYLYKLTWE